jgi:RNA polymerase sigma-70 factor (ECF subfamily)
LDIEKALAELSPLSRAVLWLHDVEGYTHEEIASLLNRSVSFSKSQLSRGHARLRALLADEGKDPTCGI